MHPCYTKAAIILLATTTFSFFTAAAQEKNPLINSGELVKKGQQLHDDKKYKEAIDEYNKIDKSDTNYVIALQELSYSFYADSQLDRSLQTAKLGMELFPNKYVPFSLQAANTLDDMDKSTEAISLYDSALVRSPQSFLLYFNKGVVNYKLKNYAECKKNFQQCILMNPYYTSAHYFLGKAYMLEGNLVPAMLAFNTYLLMAPGGKYFSNVITALSDISKVSDDILEYTKNKSNSKEDDFSMQQDILLSKLAFDKKYKLKADLEDNIVRQIQVVNEKLEYNKSDKGFCMQYYVPFFIQTMNDDNFEAMVFTAFSGVTNNKIESWQKKNKKEKQAFIDKASAYFDAIKRTRILDPQTRNESSYSYIYSNTTLIGHGLSTKDKDPVPTGKWEYYHDNGAVKAVGSFDNTGEKDGLWTYYHDNGQVKEKSTMVHGKLNGTADAWFDNGNKWYTDTYVDGKLNGIQAINFYNGNPKSITSYKDDMKNGEEKFYDYKGFLTSSDTYVDDKLEGWSRAYYPDGKVKSEVMFKKDKGDGTYKSFFNSGKLYIQGEFKDGMRQGLWTTYFEDGVVSEKTVYVDNDITGEFTEYYSSGKLSRKGTYYKKKMDGKLENFDEDGKVFGELIYDRGKLKEVNFYDKAGNVISNTTTRKGAATITFYSAEGIKTSEGYFNRDGYKDGKFTEYYNSGSVSEESNWKAGVKDGPQINYYPDGKISKKTNFKDGEEDGYVTDYYANGKISSEGWRVEGKRQQHYLYHNNVGDLTTD